MPMDKRGAALVRVGRPVVAGLVLVLALWWLRDLVHGPTLRQVAGAVTSSPAPILLALLGYAAGFGLRSWLWCRLQPGLSAGQSWAAIHVSLLGNHVLPLRLGEVLRVTSAHRRTGLPVRDLTAGTVLLRSADLATLLLVAALATPAVLTHLLGAAPAMVIGAVLLVLVGAAWWWARRRAVAGTLRAPDGWTLAGAGTAWLAEALVLWSVAQVAGVPLTYPAAAGVTAVTVFAQVVALTPGGFGTYEAAGAAALVSLGVDPRAAFAVVLTTHAVKTVYSLLVGGVALLVPAPGYFGRFRLPRTLPARPSRGPVLPDAPVVVFLPAFDEEETVAPVVSRVPAHVAHRPVRVVVIDDGSTDATAARAEAAGAHVVRLGSNRGLGAAVRRGLAEASALSPAAGVYLDADAEYQPEDITLVVAPVLAGEADYVVGSRFAGQIETMRPHRRFGNRVLTLWVRWLTRRPDLTDGQSGFRAFSPEALASAEVVHDYNYAQVLTLDLLAKGFSYREVPIRYKFRTTGRSFVSLGRYLRKVVPAVHRELNPAAAPAVDLDRASDPARTRLVERVRGPQARASSTGSAQSSTGSARSSTGSAQSSTT